MSVSSQHAAITQLFVRSIRYILEKAGLEHIAAQAEGFRAGDTNMVDIAPTEGAADVLLLTVGAFRCFFIGEIQRAIDPDKPLRWVWYSLQTAMREQCHGYLIIMATNPETARWARAFAEKNRNFFVQYIVLDASDFPTNWSDEDVREHFESALITVAIHGDTGVHNDLTDRVWRVLKDLRNEKIFDPHTFHVYTSILVANAPKDWRHDAMERDMELTRWYDEQMSKVAARYQEQGLERGLEQGLERGLEQGLERGLEQGLERGLEQGKLEHARDTLRLIALKLGLNLSDTSDQNIRACTNLAQLEQWTESLFEQEKGAHVDLIENT